MKKVLFILLAFLATVTAIDAQRVVKGRITDKSGDPVIGANVVAKGTNLGTITDLDGNYSLSVPESVTTLVMSYTGFNSQDIVLGASNMVDVTMEEGVLLQETVVTALGIQRNARNITYSNQTVSADELNSSPNKNTLEALRGKTAGVKISTGSGSVGASSRIVLRGESSLTGNNNALIVVDGAPIDNDASRGGNSSATLGATASTGYADYGNRFNDLNPEDIASVTVLKGASATAVYGSRGASGVLVITTKKGQESKDKLNVGFSTSYSVDEAYVLLKRQDKFGQGFDGNVFDSGENFSWGPAYDGIVRPWTSPVDPDGDGKFEFLSRPFSAVPNQLNNFFRLGFTKQNNISFSGNSDKFSYYASYGNTNQTGILDNTDYNRNSFNVSSTAKLTKRFKTDFSINYSIVKINGAQEGSRGFDGQNAYAAAVQTPGNIPFSELRDYKSKFHNLDGYYGSYTGNPYFTLYEYVNEGKINNLLGSMNLSYNLFEGLDLVGKFGTNYITRDIRTITPQFAHTEQTAWTNNLELITGRTNRPSSVGELLQSNANSTNLNFTGQANYTRKLTSRIKLASSLGYDIFDRRTNRIEGFTQGGFVVPGWYHLNNGLEGSRSAQASTRYRINGVFGNINLGYNDWLYVDYSARNDWSSTLPKANNSFFYQAVGVSAVLSEVLGMKNSKISDFLKLRASIGTTGKDAGLYLLESSFLGNPVFQPLANGHDLFFPLNNQSGFTLGNAIGNPNLKPELTVTTEVGADISFFQDRVSLEYTFYNADHSDQIVEINLPSSSGFTTTTKNIGKINNKGHELGVTLRPLGRLSKVNWELNLTYSKNKNKVIKISDQQDELSIGAFPLSLVAKEGLPFGTFKGVVIDQTADGKTILDASGNPVLAKEEKYLGSYQPDFLAGLNNKVSYRGFTLGFLVDWKKGGKFYSYTKNLAEFNGTGLSTLLNDRKPYIIPGVVQQADGTYKENAKAISVYDYLLNLPDSKHLVDASYVKLREVTLSYNLSRSMCSKLKLNDITIGIFGKNLKFWLPEENTWADPEVNGPALSGNAGGIETTQTPPSRSYGINLSIKF